jgi:hypothetical protein
MRRLSHRLSPALVIACLALFVALGSGAYAAIKLPKNSVGTTQLKNNAVTAAKVKDHSLLKKDFKNGQLPVGAAGAAGPAGPQGPQGPQGVQGPKGDKGDVGPANTKAFQGSIASPGTLAHPAETTLVTQGVVSVVGKCWDNGGTTYAGVFLRSTQDGVAASDYGTAGENQTVDADPGDHSKDVEVEYQSNDGGTSARDFEGPYDGTFAVEPADASFYMTGSLTTATHLNASGPACSFGGVVFIATS